MGSDANRTTALNILSYRRFETRSLRAGYHLPFQKAFDFFAMQHCCRPHDKVFGYLGLTNSRIQVDYSMSILDLFVATLADYLLSAGLITEHLKRKHVFRHLTAAAASNLTAPFLAFDLDASDPVVCLLFHEVAEFFAPGFGKALSDHAMTNWWIFNSFKERCPNLDAFDFDDFESEYRYIGSLCVKTVKLVANRVMAFLAFRKAIAERQKALAQNDAVMTDSKSGESKKYSEWTAHARAISEQMWRRFQESGEDAEGDMDDEAWTLIA
jgi:hypothetical protein